MLKDLQNLKNKGYINEKGEIKEDIILWSRDNDTVIIPTKREEDSDYDIYANFLGNYIIIFPGETKSIPTNLRCAMNKKWRLCLEERGSTGTKGMIQQSGIIDSGYRGCIKVPITNGGNKPIIILKKDVINQIKDSPIYLLLNDLATIYPYDKAICQAKIDIVPKLENITINSNDLLNIPSERKTNKLGSTGK